ncbi:hypothetical protein DXG01_004572 [Tephrocybe rancida]|nr:hypothetical protein DXG01_004572 [Tephrocybe rancida]
MDPSLYKSVTTRRGLKYNYYRSAPTAGKPFLLFVHGFPSTSYDWRYQAEFFKDQGYGLIIPDMLGYGGTDKPADYADYRMSLMCQDVIDILDAENVDQAIAVGHDWYIQPNSLVRTFAEVIHSRGSGLVSRLANYFPERFSAFAFIAVGYVPPSQTKFADVLAQTTKIAGYELFGYWNFFAAEGAPELIEKNIDSFYSLMLTEDPKLWAAHLAPSGAVKAWVEGNNKTTFASYISEEEREKQKEELLRGGLAGPVSWYKVRVFDLDGEDSQDIAPENILIQKPVFLGAALQDYICLAPLQKAVVSQSVKGPLTIKDFNTGHWVQWQEKDKLNQELVQWVEKLAL